MLSKANISQMSHAKSLRENLDFSPFGLTAKADASGVDLKVRVAQDDISWRKALWTTAILLPNKKTALEEQSFYSYVA